MEIHQFIQNHFNNNFDLDTYYPICKEKNCYGILKFVINPYNFTINYICEKNEMHKGENISFEEFNNLFLKMKTDKKDKKHKNDKNYKNNFFFEYINDIKEKEKKYNEIIKSILEWEKKIKNLIDDLKKNLQYEIMILKKLLFKVDEKYLNKAYCKNINYLKNYIKKINNLYLKNIYNYQNKEEKEKAILEYFCEKRKNENEYLKQIYFTDFEIKNIYKLDENMILFVINNHDKDLIHLYIIIKRMVLNYSKNIKQIFLLLIIFLFHLQLIKKEYILVQNIRKQLKFLIMTQINMKLN